MDDRDLMMRFCSLGNNCEVGLVQRAYGAEPIDLFRWAATPLHVLTRLLEARFEGIGEDLEAIQMPREIMVRNHRYGFTWHAFAPPDATPAEVEKREARRLPFLARKLTEDIIEGSRVFVVKPWAHGPIGIDAFARLLDVLDGFGGRPTLLAVYPGARPSPALLRQSERFLIGSINKFNTGDGRMSPGVAEDWRDLLRLAHSVTPHEMPLPVA